MLILIPIGIGTKQYHGLFGPFVRNSLGGVLYVVFFSLALFFISRRVRPLLNVAAVFIATAGIEFLQLWHPPFLQWARARFLGRLFLGTTFMPSDFFYYAVGAILSYGILHLLLRYHD